MSDEMMEQDGNLSLCYFSEVLVSRTLLEMNEQVQLCVTGASVLALVYSVSLNVFRHWVYEDKGMVDTCMDLLINASPFAISQLLVVHCADQVLCNVRSHLMRIFSL